jgi:hypothetical protein
MKKLVLLMSFALLWLVSCQQEESILKEEEVTFSIGNLLQNDNPNGRTATTAEPKSLLVTIEDRDGTTVVTRKELTLHKFGERYLSVPLTLKTSGASSYRLTEFMVTDAGGNVVLATPKEGSALAHVVTDPLAIEFSVNKDQITTVTPEVLEVNEGNTPEEFGYGQFGFSLKETVPSVVSAFIKGDSNFQLTTAHLKVEGLRDTTSADTTAFWSYETELEAKANVLTFIKAPRYKLTITKAGYRPWVQNLTTKDVARIEAILESGDSTYHIYLAGGAYVNGTNKENARAIYWRNGEAVVLSNIRSHAEDIFVQGSDVYVAGYEYPNSQYTQAFYWKNGEKVILSSAVGSTRQVIAQGNDVHVIGYTYHPDSDRKHRLMYWKNGIGSELQVTDTRPDAFAWIHEMAIYNGDIYIIGEERVIASSTQIYYAGLFWKNGVLQSIQKPLNIYPNIPMGYKSISIDSGQVYIAGQYYDNNRILKTIIWKNGSIRSVSPSPLNRAPIHFVVENDIVHLISFEQGYHYRKNDVKIWSIRHPSEMRDITISGQDVFIAGKSGQTFQTTVPTYWVNGVENKIRLGSNYSIGYAQSIFVK